MKKAALYILFFLLAAVFLPADSHAQSGGKDTINYSSTCVNTTILFGTPLFDSLPFPSYINGISEILVRDIMTAPPPSNPVTSSAPRDNIISP
jgi:hypothetical protein